jgi:membrane protease YdiL (CAAX protease family)
MQTPRQKALTAIVEIAVLFLPGIPAYIWLWPHVFGAGAEIATILTYFYFLLGALIIGLRRWNWNQLGINRCGIAHSLICGSSLIAVLILGRLALDLPWQLELPTVERIVYDIFFYIGLVGVVEELLFRGVLFRALDEWRGARWAIGGTAIAFGIYHVGGQGLVGGFGTAFIGLFFALIRWRAGGIVGLVLIHGLYDIIAIEGWGELTTIDLMRQLPFINRPLAIVCDGILLATFVYLWKIYPRQTQRRNLEK